MLRNGVRTVTSRPCCHAPCFNSPLIGACFDIILNMLCFTSQHLSTLLALLGVLHVVLASPPRLHLAKRRNKSTATASKDVTTSVNASPNLSSKTFSSKSALSSESALSSKSALGSNSKLSSESATAQASSKQSKKFQR